MSTKMTGKKAVLEMLRAEGVTHIFGNPGTSESPFLDALENYPDLRYILVLQEGVEMGMAHGFAHATGGRYEQEIACSVSAGESSWTKCWSATLTSV